MPGRTSRGAIQVLTPLASMKAATSWASSRFSELWLMKTCPLIPTPFCANARRRYPLLSRLGNGALRAPRAEHVGDGDELLARIAFAGPRHLGRFDPLPVAEGDDVDLAF